MSRNSAKLIGSNCYKLQKELLKSSKWLARKIIRKINNFDKDIVVYNYKCGYSYVCFMFPYHVLDDDTGVIVTQDMSYVYDVVKNVAMVDMPLLLYEDIILDNEVGCFAVRVDFFTYE